MYDYTHETKRKEIDILKKKINLLVNSITEDYDNFVSQQQELTVLKYKLEAAKHRIKSQTAKGKKGDDLTLII